MPSIKTPAGTLNNEEAAAEAVTGELKLDVGVALKFSNQKYIKIKGRSPRKKVRDIDTRDLIDDRLTLNLDKIRK